MAKRKDKDALARELGDEFRVNQNLNEVFDEAAAARLRVNSTGLRCLDIIQRLGQVTAGELAREAGLTTGAVTSVVDRLVDLGYAVREDDPGDRRKVLITLTPTALDAVYEIWGPETREYIEQFTSVPRVQLEQMIEFMREANEIQRRALERIRKPG